MSEEEGETVNYREEVLRLVAEGKIKHTTKYVEKASDETVEKIYKSYLMKQLDETNDHIADTLIKQLYELMTSLELIDDGESLEKDLEKYPVLHNTVHSVCGIGVRGICLGKHVMKKRVNQQEEEN